MEKLIIFYDDTRPSCCRCISRFEGKENVECRKASEYLEKIPVLCDKREDRTCV